MKARFVSFVVVALAATLALLFTSSSPRHASAQMGPQTSGPHVPPTLGGRPLAGPGLAYGSGSQSGSLRIGTCPTGQTQVSTGAGYACSAVGGGGGGGTTEVVDGVSLSGTGSAGSPFAAITTYLQRRVTGTCGGGEAIGTVNADGTVTCNPFGDVSEVQGGTGISVASGTGPVPIVSANLAGGSCSAQSFLSALSSGGAGTCTAIDNTYWQQRVSGTCAAGSSIRVISSSGTVTCETDDDTTYTAGAGMSATGTTFNVGAVTNGGIVVNADTIGLRADCGSGAILERDPTNADQWICGVDDVGGGGGISGLTTGTLPVATSATTIGDSIAVQSGTVVTFTDTARATSNLHAPGVRWGSATDGSTGQLVTSGGVVTYLDFIDDLQLRIADNAYITPLRIDNAGVSTFNFNVNAEANIQLDDVGDITWSSTGTAGGAVDVGIARSAVGQVVINDGDGILATDYRDIAVRNQYWTALHKTIDLGTIEWSATNNLSGATDLEILRAASGLLGVTNGTAGTYRDAVARTWYGNETGPSFKAVALGRVEWSSSAVYNAATDIALGRNAAGTLEVTSGTAATWRDIIARTHFGGGTAAGTSFKAHSVGRIEWSSTTAHTGASDLGLERSSAGNLVVNDGAGVTVADMRDLNSRSHFGHITAGTAYKATSTGRVEWSSTTLIGGASDLGLERSAAGVLVVNDGAGILTADLRDLTARYLIASGSFATTATGTAFNNNLDTKGYAIDSTGAPTLSGCGTGPTSSIGRNAITVTTGTGATGCTITFGGAGAFAAVPTCVVSSQTANKAFTYTVSTSAVTLASASASNAYDIVCIGH
jgi:hypothetical protein